MVHEIMTTKKIKKRASDKERKSMRNDSNNNDIKWGIR